jgi:hypothetical protein
VLVPGRVVQITRAVLEDLLDADLEHSLGAVMPGDGRRVGQDLAFAVDPKLGPGGGHQEQQADLPGRGGVSQGPVHAVSVVTRNLQRRGIDHPDESRQPALVGALGHSAWIDGGEVDGVSRLYPADVIVFELVEHVVPGQVSGEIHGAEVTLQGAAAVVVELAGFHGYRTARICCQT